MGVVGWAVRSGGRECLGPWGAVDEVGVAALPDSEQVSGGGMTAADAVQQAGAGEPFHARRDRDHAVDA